MKYQKAVININTSKGRVFSFRIDYPSKWTVIEEQGEEPLITLLSPPKSETSLFRELLNVIIIKNLMPSPEILETYSMNVVNDINIRDSPKVKIQLSDTTLFGIPAKEFCYERNKDNQELMTYNRWTIIDMTAIILSWTTLRNCEKSFRSVIRRMIKSIRLP